MFIPTHPATQADDGIDSTALGVWPSGTKRRQMIPKKSDKKKYKSFSEVEIVSIVLNMLFVAKGQSKESDKPKRYFPQVYRSGGTSLQRWLRLLQGLLILIALDGVTFLSLNWYCAPTKNTTLVWKVVYSLDVGRVFIYWYENQKHDINKVYYMYDCQCTFVGNALIDYTTSCVVYV